MNVVRAFLPAVLLAFLLAIFSPVQAQTATSVQRDPAAIAAVQQAITALGGASSISAVSNCTATGSMQSNVGNQQTIGFTWTNAGREFRYEYADGSYFVSNGGAPFLVANGKKEQFFAHTVDADLPLHLAAVVLYSRLQDPTVSIRLNSTVSGNGAGLIVVQLSKDQDSTTQGLTKQVWYLDSSTYLPVAAEFNSPQRESADILTAKSATFADYKSENGILVPTTISVLSMNVIRTNISIQSVQFNSGIDAATFTGGVN